MTASRPAARILAILGLISLGATRVSLAQDFTFQPPVSYDTGSDTPGIALADLNHDGHLDLIVATCENGAVRVRLGDGSGTFGAPTDIPLVSNDVPSAFGIAVADFNNDTFPDIATASDGEGKVYVLYGDGMGAFPTQASFDVGLFPSFVLAGDFNEDGRPDLAVPNGDSNNLTILLNDGAGGFSPATGSPLPTAFGPYYVRAADLNGDNHLDLVIPGGPNNLTLVYLGNGNGTFTLTSFVLSLTMGAPFDAAILDFNRDSIPDLVVSALFADALELYTGNGDGTFTPFDILLTGAYPFAIAAADMNGDGLDDVIVADGDDDAVEVLLGDGFTLVSSSPIDLSPDGAGPQSLATGDINGDGKIDLAVGHEFSENSLILISDTCCFIKVTIAGTGGGTVSSSPVRIACAPDCYRAFPSVSSPSFFALPNEGSLFVGWSGLCSGTNPNDCVIPAGVEGEIVATFDALALSPGSLPGGTVGVPYTAAVTATNGTPPYSFTVNSGTFPPGLDLADDGQITGTPTQGGTFAFTIGGSDSAAVAGTQAYSITIAAAATSTTAAPATATYNDAAQAVALSATIADGVPVNGGTVTFTVRNGASAVIGSPVTSGAVSAGAAMASYSLPGGTPAQTLTITAVYNGSASFLTSSNTASLVVSAASSTTTAANATAPFSASPQSVPLTATVSSANGTVNSGTVTFTVRTAGSVVVGSPVSGSVSGGAASATFTLPGGTAAQTLTVTAAYGATTNFGASSGTANLVVTAGCSTLTISPTTVPTVWLGQPFSVTFTASGMSGATVAVTGTPPAGLTASGGTVSGTATELGRFDLIATASVGGSCATSVTYPFRVMRSPMFAAAAGSTSPDVRLFDNRGTMTSSFLADTPSFAGGIRVAMADLNADGIADVITAPGGSAPPIVHVFNGATGAPLSSFTAYPSPSSGGMYVAAGDVNGDGVPDIITGRDGAAPEVRVFDGRTNTLISSFLAYGGLGGGVRVAAGDVDADGIAEIITSQPFGSAPEVRIYSAAGALRTSFMTYNPAFIGGVFVAAGDIDGDGRADIITGADAGGGPHVLAFSGVDLHVLRSFFAYDPAFPSGVRVAAGDLDLDGHAEIITAAGPGGGPHVRVFDGVTGAETVGMFAFDPAFPGGVYVAAPIAQARMAIDTPAPGSTVLSAFSIRGWVALPGSTTDAGADIVHVWAVPIAGGAPLFVGPTTVGLSRPDVGAVLGGAYADSGFSLMVETPLPPGTYDLWVFARSTRTGTFTVWRIVRVTQP